MDTVKTSCQFSGELELVYKFMFFIWTKETVVQQGVDLTASGEVPENAAYNFMQKNPQVGILTQWNYPYEFRCDQMQDELFIYRSKFSFCPSSSGVRVNFELTQLPMNTVANVATFFQKFRAKPEASSEEIRSDLLKFKAMFEKMSLPSGKPMLLEFERFCLHFHG